MIGYAVLKRDSHFFATEQNSSGGPHGQARRRLSIAVFFSAIPVLAAIDERRQRLRSKRTRKLPCS